jgi:hypothetical protein
MDLISLYNLFLNFPFDLSCKKQKIAHGPRTTIQIASLIARALIELKFNPPVNMKMHTTQKTPAKNNIQSDRDNIPINFTFLTEGGFSSAVPCDGSFSLI